MGKYNGAVITAAGQNLIAQAIAQSKTVTFTTAQASSHVYPSSTDFEALTALTDVEKTVDINYAGVYSDTVVQVSARFDNNGVETAYLINAIGFFAQLDSDTPILFAVSTAVTPDQMPVFDADNPSAFIYNMQMTVQNANSINLSVNPAGTVTVDQLNAVVSTINAKIGDLSDLTTDDKTSLVNSINEVDAHADAAQASANIVQAQVSNSGDAYSPSKAYKVGDLCIYNNVLYRCTTACSAGSWATNQSCFVADTLVNVVNDVSFNLSKIAPSNFKLLATITPSNLSGILQRGLGAYKYIYVKHEVNNYVNALFVVTSDIVNKPITINTIVSRGTGNITTSEFYSDLAVHCSVTLKSDNTWSAILAYCNVNFVGEISVFGIEA